MTPEKFKSYPNCGHYTDEQAQAIILTLKKMAVMLFQFTCQENGTVIDNQHVITTNQSNNQNLAA
jgi:hypothetical protein